MHKPLVLCICGTDTDAGKTVATAGLLAAMRALGADARALKPVQTGCAATPSGELLAPDVLVYRQAAPDAPAHALVCLEEACSPHLAAARAGIRLSVAGPAGPAGNGGLAGRIAEYAEQAGVVLVEAAGGLLAPLNESESMADLFAALSRQLDAQIILVAANRLGAVNHALLSLEALRSRGLSPAGFIMCNTAPVADGSFESSATASPASVETEIRKDNPRIISEQGRVPCLAELPYLPELFCLPDQVGRKNQAGLEHSLTELSSEGEISAKPGNGNAASWMKIAEILRPAAEYLLRGHGHYEAKSAGQASVPATGPATGTRTIEGNEKLIGQTEPDALPDTLPNALPGALPHVLDDEETRRLLAFDREHLWHPYTSALHPLKAWEARATEGPYIHLRYVPPISEDFGNLREAELANLEAGSALQASFDGLVLDGMSSWWAAVHGYNHPDLMAALHRQAREMPHVMFGGITHEPAVELGQRLLELAPENMEHVFLADSGSVSVEVALKMAVQYQRATGNSGKSAILTVCGGYHGDTLGAMSVCDPVNGMHGLFSGVLPAQIFAPRPECRFDAPFDPASLQPVERLFAENAGRIAAVILEPIVQGAGGMWFYHPQYLAGLRKLCDRHGALLILDEIATGFGRTGKMFACEWAGIVPDIMCVGKALTGGVMTLAATLASREIAHGISRGGGVLMHGPTFMGNPLACAVASASLKLLCEFPWRERVARMEELMRERLVPCAGLDEVRDVRVLGGIGVVEMERAVNVEALQDFFVREHRVWIRPFGKLIYMMPPYVVSQGELERLCLAVTEALERKKWA